jgi:hypothetical protein
MRRPEIVVWYFVLIYGIFYYQIPLDTDKVCLVVYKCLELKGIL